MCGTNRHSASCHGMSLVTVLQAMLPNPVSMSSHGQARPRPMHISIHNYSITGMFVQCFIDVLQCTVSRRMLRRSLLFMRQMVPHGMFPIMPTTASQCEYPSVYGNTPSFWRCMIARLAPCLGRRPGSWKQRVAHLLASTSSIQTLKKERREKMNIPSRRLCARVAT